MDQRLKNKNDKAVRIKHGGKLHHTGCGRDFLGDAENTGNRNENINQSNPSVRQDATESERQPTGREKMFLQILYLGRA